MPSWQRNLFSVGIAEFVALAGVTVSYPFLPYFVQELGVTGQDRVAMWSGALIASMATAMGVFAPFWGSLADRYGRRLMVVRAMFAGALVFGAMAYVQNVEQLLGLQVLLGSLSGTVAAASPLVAASVPRERRGFAMGLLQTAVYSGASTGPLIGGVVADHLGYRAVYMVTGGMLFLAGMIVVVFTREETSLRRYGPEAQETGIWDGLRTVLCSRRLLAVLGVDLMLRMATRMLLPVLPLFVQALVPDEARVPTIVGLITGVGAATSASGAVFLGRVSDRIGQRTVLLACGLGLAAAYVPQFYVSTPFQLLLLQAAAGAAMGGGLAAIGALIANLAPPGQHGAVYGVDATAVSAANALGPLTGAAVAVGLGLRAPFLAAAAMYALAALVVALVIPRHELQQTRGVKHIASV